MIDSIASILRSIVMLVTLGLVVFIGWKGYQAYKVIESKFAAVEKYFTKIERVIGEHDKRFSRFDKFIDKFKPGEPPLVPDKYPIPIEDTYIEQAPARTPSENGRPIVYLYSIEGCGPCEQWWRDVAPLWMQAGWVVERKASTNNRPTPYWRVWDGEKWLEFDRTLHYEKYKAAGGR